ncbi:hypothetical protein SynPROS91_01082 [Synechococcus sp. PROS-9-1]|nr:hypothetical protein SynPROS91_01082 [Synechococcus sp. PROS-9-1]
MQSAIHNKAETTYCSVEQRSKQGIVRAIEPYQCNVPYACRYR